MNVYGYTEDMVSTSFLAGYSARAEFWMHVCTWLNQECATKAYLSSFLPSQAITALTIG